MRYNVVYAKSEKKNVTIKHDILAVKRENYCFRIIHFNYLVN